MLVEAYTVASPFSAVQSELLPTKLAILMFVVVPSSIVTGMDRMKSIGNRWIRILPPIIQGPGSKDTKPCATPSSGPRIVDCSNGTVRPRPMNTSLTSAAMVCPSL